MSGSHIGIRLADGTFFPILEKTALGKKRLTLTTVHDSQEMVQVSLYQGSDDSDQDPEYVGTLVIERLASAPAGEPDIRLVVGVDEEGNLNATATDTASGEYQSLSVSLQSMEEDLLTAMPDFALDEDQEIVDETIEEPSDQESAEPDFDEESLSDLDEEMDLELEDISLERDESALEEEPFPAPDATEEPDATGETEEADPTLDELIEAADDGSPNFDDLVFEDPDEEQPDTSALDEESLSLDEESLSLDEEPLSLDAEDDSFDETLLSIDDGERLDIGGESEVVESGVDESEEFSIDDERDDAGEAMNFDEDFSLDSLDFDSSEEESASEPLDFDEPLDFGESSERLDADDPFGSDDGFSPPDDAPDAPHGDVDRREAVLDRRSEVPSYDEDQERSERPGVVLFLGFVLLALAALGFLTYIIFRAIENPNVPAIGAMLPGLAIRPVSLRWRRPRAVR